MASLYQRNDTYYARFTDPDRGRKRVSLRTSDAASARALLTRFEHLVALGEADPWADDLHELVRPAPAKRLSLGKAFEEFLGSKRAENCKENTLRTYRETVGHLISEVGHGKPLGALTPSRIRCYVHVVDLAPATRRKRYRQIRAFLNYYELDALSEVEKPRVEEKMPQAIRPDELESIVEAMKYDYVRLRSSSGLPPGRVLWRVPVFQFAFLTGLRRSEIARLRWRDVEAMQTPGEGCLVLQEQKSRRQERLPLSSKAARLLTRIPQGAPEEYVFVSPVAGSATRRQETSWGESTSRAFAKYRDLAEVRDTLTFHSLRAGYITMLARSGLNAVAIKRLARHKAIKTSLRYIEATGEAFREGLDRAF